MRIALISCVVLAGLMGPTYPVIKVTGEPPLWKLEPLSVIVSPDGAGFARLGPILLDPHGGLLVVDRKENVIYRYSDQGKMLGTIGRVGSGPSEYRSPYALGWLGDDLMVYDPSNGRILHWDRNARFIEQWPLSLRLTGAIRVFAGRNGSLWLEQGTRGPSGKYQGNFLHLTRTGIRDTIWLPLQEGSSQSGPPKGRDGYVVCIEKNGSFTWFNSPFTLVTSHAVVTIDGQLLDHSGYDYRLAQMKAPGDTARVLEHLIARAPVSDAEWKAGLAEYEEWMPKHGDQSCSGRQVRPATKPAIRDLATDDVGRVWVERYMKNGFQWEAWQGDKIVGAFAIPDTMRNTSTAFSADRVALGRYREDDGGYEVRLFRIRK